MCNQMRICLCSHEIGSDFHDYHHFRSAAWLKSTDTGNFASTFTYLDKIYGTDIGYSKFKSKVGKQGNAPPKAIRRMGIFGWWSH